MDYTKFSSVYQVRRLLESDIEEIYALSMGNPRYFFYCPPKASRESIVEDMNALPPDKTYMDKYYIGYFKDNELICIMDFIDNYPISEVAFIGLFMMKKEFQNQHIGSDIIRELIDYLNSLEYKKIRLGYSSKNEQSKAFWLKNGFVPTGKVDKSNEAFDVVVMEYVLR